MSRPKRERWRATVRTKDDAMVVRVAEILRDCESWRRKYVVMKALALRGEWELIDKMRAP